MALLDESRRSLEAWVGIEAAAAARDIAFRAHAIQQGGRGIFLMNQLMDEVRFADGGRKLHMRKALRVPER